LKKSRSNTDTETHLSGAIRRVNIKITRPKFKIEPLLVHIYTWNDGSDILLIKCDSVPRMPSCVFVPGGRGGCKCQLPNSVLEMNLPTPNKCSLKQ